MGWFSDIVALFSGTSEWSGRSSADSGVGNSLPPTPVPIDYIKHIMVFSEAVDKTKEEVLSCVGDKVLTDEESVLSFLRSKGYAEEEWVLSYLKGESKGTFAVVKAVKVKPYLPASEIAPGRLMNCVYCELGYRHRRRTDAVCEPALGNYR